MDKCQRCGVAIEGGNYCQTCGPILATRKEWKERLRGVVQIVVFVVTFLVNLTLTRDLWIDPEWNQAMGRFVLFPIILSEVLDDMLFVETGPGLVTLQGFGVVVAFIQLDGWWCVLASVVWFFVVTIIGVIIEPD